MATLEDELLAVQGRITSKWEEIEKTKATLADHPERQRIVELDQQLLLQLQEKENLLLKERAAAQAQAAAAPQATQAAHAADVLERIDESVALISRVLPIVLVPVKREFGPPTTASRGSNAPFKNSLIQYYGMNGHGKLRCMVLDELLPREFVCAGHLLPRKHEDYTEAILGFKDIADRRNGLLWNSAIEDAYELQKICFSFVRACIFRLHVIDKELMGVKLADCGKDKNNKTFQTLMGERTFGELHNSEMDFSDPSGVGPFKRALAFQAMNALSTQRTNYPDSFIRDEHNFDYMSEFSGKDELIKAWLSDSIDQDSQ